MRHKKNLILFIGFSCSIGLLIFSHYSFASFIEDDEGLSKGASSYLSMGVGARPLGMGNTFVAISDDSSCIYWNPAGLSQIRHHEIMTMSGILGIDRYYNYFDYVYPLSRGKEKQDDFLTSWSWGDENEEKEPSHGGLGIGWINFSIKNIEGRDDYGKPTGNFEDREDTFILAYGQSWKYNFSIGANFKYHTQKLEKEEAKGFSFDIGTLYKPTQSLSFGLCVQNIAGYLKWSFEEETMQDDILLNIRLGSAYKPLKDKLLLALDIEQTLKQNVRFHLGSEYQILKNICFRIGSDNLNLTLGCGLKLPLKITTLKLDYALLMDFQEDLNWINRFSLQAVF